MQTFADKPREENELELEKMIQFTSVATCEELWKLVYAYQGGNNDRRTEAPKKTNRAR